MNTELMKSNEATPGTVTRQEYIRPFYRITPDENQYLLEVFMPGVPRDEARITLEGDQLTIEGRRARVGGDDWQSVSREIPTADYRLVLTLNVDVDGGKIKASTVNGVLNVTLPVAEEARPRRIEVT